MNSVELTNDQHPGGLYPRLQARVRPRHRSTISDCKSNQMRSWRLLPSVSLLPDKLSRGKRTHRAFTRAAIEAGSPIRTAFRGKRFTPFARARLTATTLPREPQCQKGRGLSPVVPPSHLRSVPVAQDREHNDARLMTNVNITCCFLARANSLRNIMAECAINRWGRGRFKGFSAGSHLKGDVHSITASSYISSKRSSLDAYRH